MSIPAVSAVDPEIKPWDVAAVPTAQPPICHQSFAIGGKETLVMVKELFFMIESHWFSCACSQGCLSAGVKVLCV